MWSASGERAAGGDPRWLWRVRRGHRLDVWNDSDRATLHLSQTMQCGGQVPGRTQRRGIQGNEKAVDGAGQRSLPDVECPGSVRTFGGLCRAVASANPESRGNVGTLQQGGAVQVSPGQFDRG
jgi:hypothetical protein